MGPCLLVAYACRAVSVQHLPQLSCRHRKHKVLSFLPALTLSVTGAAWTVVCLPWLPPPLETTILVKISWNAASKSTIMDKMLTTNSVDHSQTLLFIYRRTI